MPTSLDIPLFVVSLAVALGSAGIFARALDRLGVRIGLPEALLGLLTALAADGPEITSAIVALLKGAAGVSLGVVVGSNVFNLAAMLGLTVLLAGGIRLQREALAIEGSVGLLVAFIATGVVLDVLPAAIAALLIGIVLVPYLLLLARGPRIARRLPFSERLDRRLGSRSGSARALGSSQEG
jgi:cation:H+ antiporter